uniref:Uncharacterized protein n=1 Tax=Rhizophora mucronata TaxID=61149 RepID=A0A2P2PHT8_RHIMU
MIKRERKKKMVRPKSTKFLSLFKFLAD